MYSATASGTRYRALSPTARRSRTSRAETGTDRVSTSAHSPGASASGATGGTRRQPAPQAGQDRLRRRAVRVERAARPVPDPECREGAQPLRGPPRGQVEEGVAPHQEEQPSARPVARQRLDGIDRVGGPGALQLDGRRDEARVAR